MTSIQPHHGTRSARIVIIGAGPAGVMLLERIVANHHRDSPDAALQIDLVDPFEPGGGRIWRRSQSPLLKLNSMLRDVTAFTDDSCRIDGPVAAGPSLAEWVEQVRAGAIQRPDWHDAALDAEINHIGPADFPTRRLNNGYLSWVYSEIVRRASDAVSITWHQDRAVRVEGDAAVGASVGSGSGSGSAHISAAPHHRVLLSSGAHLGADVVVHTIGHTGSAPSAESIRLQDFASRHNLTYIAPAFTADVDLSDIAAAEPVIVRGMGLAATDLIVLLTEGRGGRFERDSTSLHYIASGREPIIHLGSGRGVPYRSKITSTTVGDPQQLEYLGESFHRNVAERSTALDFDDDVWPLIAAEMLTGYYRELCTGHPDRVLGTWAEFHVELRAILQRPGGAESVDLLSLVRERVPHLDDRFDLTSFDRPLLYADEGNTSDDVHSRVRAHVAQDLRQRTSPEHSATHALFMTVLFSYLSLTEVPAHQWNARSRTRTLPGRWHRYFSYLASGPPGHRLDELLALADAGIVRFLGGNLSLEASEEARTFAASGTACVGLDADRSRVVGQATAIARSAVTARTLIDAWLPDAQARSSDNPYLRALVTNGIAHELSVADESYTGSTGQIEVGVDGRLPGVHAQFAIGPFTSLPTGGAFARPRLNSLPFRVHDRCARSVLAELGAGVAAGGVTADGVTAIGATAGGVTASGVTAAAIAAFGIASEDQDHEPNLGSLDHPHQDRNSNLWTDSELDSDAHNPVSEEALSPQFSR